MAARIGRVGEALWPEVTGMAAVAGVQMIAAAIDERRDGERPVAQTVATVVVLGGSAYAISVDAAPGFFRGALYLGVGMGVINLSRWLVERAKAVPDRVVGGWDTLALVPRRRPGLGAGQGGQGGKLELEAPLQMQERPQPVGALLVPEQDENKKVIFA